MSKGIKTGTDLSFLDALTQVRFVSLGFRDGEVDLAGPAWASLKKLLRLEIAHSSDYALPRLLSLSPVARCESLTSMIVGHFELMDTDLEPFLGHPNLKRIVTHRRTEWSSRSIDAVEAQGIQLVQGPLRR